MTPLLLERSTLYSAGIISKGTAASSGHRRQARKATKHRALPEELDPEPGEGSLRPVEDFLIEESTTATGVTHEVTSDNSNYFPTPRVGHNRSDDNNVIKFRPVREWFKEVGFLAFKGHLVDIADSILAALRLHYQNSQKN